MNQPARSENLYKFRPGSYRQNRLDPPADGDDLTGWLSQQAPTAHWSLIHTVSGIVWGRLSEAGWLFSRQAQTHSAVPSVAELLMLRAFDPAGEVLVWREAGGLRARWLGDDGDVMVDVYDEAQMLWGTKRAAPAAAGFTPLADGDEGLVHAPPLDIPNRLLARDDAHRPVRIYLRHYASRDKDTGLARIVASRLFSLGYVEPGTQEDSDATEA